jgi:hypothetical protein
VRSSPSSQAPPVPRTSITLVEKQAATTEITFFYSNILWGGRYYGLSA